MEDRVLKPLRLGSCLIIAALAISPVFAKTRTPARDKTASADNFPSFDDVKQTVEEHFAATRDREANDLITAGSVGALFGKLEKLNWKVADRKEILKSVVPESDWLARQFATRNGRKFMRQISELPDGYDRVDRLRRMPYGERRVADMIRNPDGGKMIEYMTSTREGKNLGRMVSRGVRGEDFNKPTGRIYTQLDLLKRLKKSYELEASRRLSADRPLESKPVDAPAKGESDQPGKAANSPAPAKPDVDPFDRKDIPHG
jgi:hypothetical protein